MTIRLVILLTWIVASIGASAQVKETVIDEFFADNAAGWPEDITDTYSCSVNDGTYYLSYKRAAGSKCFDIPIKMYLGDNYFIETRGKIISGDRHGGYGIVWGKSRKGYFTFAITGSGKFYVRKVSVNGAGEYLLGPITCKFIRINGQENKIRVQYANDELMFFINDKYVGHIPRESYFGNNAGIILYGLQEVQIYNFGAFGTKNYEKLADYHAQMRVSYYEIEDGTDIEGKVLGNGDNKVSPGETIQLAVTMKNSGYGTCNGLNATFYALNDYVTVIDQKVKQVLNNVGRFQTQVLDLKFKVSPNCNSENLKFKLDITDNEGRLAETASLTVPMYTTIPSINKEDDGKISFTVNVKENNSEDINTFYPITLNNAQNTCAVVVGVENYEKLPKAKYAVNDARIFYNYLVKVLNVPRGNVIYVTNQNATLTKLTDILKVSGLLNARMQDKYCDVIFYFSGLGMCEQGKTEAHILLYGSDAVSPSTSGYSVSQILKNLRVLHPRSITCFFETSFAGVDRMGNKFASRGGTVWANASFPIVTDNNVCMMYASGGKQYNPVVDVSSHGMFTHYLLSAMQVYAKNRGTLDMETLYTYIYKRMDKEASARNISVFPRIDCVDKYSIKLLK